MRQLLLLLAVAACEQPAPITKPADTVVFYDDAMGKPLVEKRLSTLAAPELLWEGCRLAYAKGAAVIQCPANDVYIRFSCRDHVGPDHALGLMIARGMYSVYCR